MPAMTQRERAKLFMPFDAMKGLSEELRKREERHTRIFKIELSEESLEELSGMIMSLDVGAEVSVKHYRGGHYWVTTGRVQKIDLVYKFLLVSEEKIRFDDIYSIEKII